MQLRKRSEAGFTMVEVMITVIVLSIILVVMYRGLDNLQTTAVGSEERLVNLEESRLMMATVTKDLRTAARLAVGSSPFDVADSREVTFYANIGSTNGPSKVHIYVDAENRLVEEVIAPLGTSPNYTYNTPPKVRAVGSYIVPGTSLFTYQYFDEGTSSFVNLSSVPLSAADRLIVESIEVTISIRKSSTLPTPASTLVNRVRLPNIYYNPASQGQG